MPPVAAAVGAIAGGIGAAGSAAVGLAGSALGGLAAAGSGLISTGIGAVSGLSALAPKVLPIAQAGSKLYGMFQKPEDQPTAAQPGTRPAAPTTSVVPSNILNTLPNLIRGPTPAQIVTTPPMLVQAPENVLLKYAPWIAAAVIGYIVLGK